MSFESAKKRGFIASLIMVIMPVVVVILDLISFLSFFGIVFSPRNVGALPLNPLLLGGFNYILIALAVVGLVGIVMFLLSMSSLSNYYNEPKIFKNALYGLIIMFVGTAVVYGVAFAIIFGTVFSSITHPVATPTTAIFGLFAGILGLIAGFFAVAIVSALMYKRAFDKLGEKSGVQSFGTAGELILIGTALTIVVVGALIAWIGWIFALSGFNSMKPKEAVGSPMTYSSTQPLTGANQERRYCIHCGQVIAIDSDYCSYCGKPQRPQPAS